MLSLAECPSNAVNAIIWLAVTSYLSVAFLLASFTIASHYRRAESGRSSEPGFLLGIGLTIAFVASMEALNATVTPCFALALGCAEMYDHLFTLCMIALLLGSLLMMASLVEQVRGGAPDLAQPKSTPPHPPPK